MNPLFAEELAINGGKPIRPTYLPYGRQAIDESDIDAVVDVLRSDWLTTGPKVAEFEEAFAFSVGAKYAVSFSSGTAALHGSAYAAGLTSGDEAITSPLTFAATANCLLYLGAKPIFADVSNETLTLDPGKCAERITKKTKIILPVDYAGHPADLALIGQIAQDHNLVVIEDACHALGARYRGRLVGSISHLTVFSFHPVKHITTGEGGMVTTDNRSYAETLRHFRNHGIKTGARERQENAEWFYEMVLLGFNYRLSDISCALGIRQLSKLESNLQRRRKIASQYNDALSTMRGIVTPQVGEDVVPAWHLYPVRLRLEELRVGRSDVFRALRSENIGVNVHYVPVYLHPYYRTLGYCKEECPIAEHAYERLISLPMFHAMSEQDVDDVVHAMQRVMRWAVS